MDEAAHAFIGSLGWKTQSSRTFVDEWSPLFQRVHLSSLYQPAGCCRTSPKFMRSIMKHRWFAMIAGDCRCMVWVFAVDPKLSNTGLGRSYCKCLFRGLALPGPSDGRPMDYPTTTWGSPLDTLWTIRRSKYRLTFIRWCKHSHPPTRTLSDRERLFSKR